MANKAKLNRWMLWWQWLLANSLAAALPVFILQVEYYSGDRFLASIGLVGVTQWLVLRQIFTGLQLWPIVNFLGWGLGLYSGILYFLIIATLPLLVKRLGKPIDPDIYDIDYISPLILLGAPVIIGVSIGLVQMLFLKSKLAKPSWWILANAIAIPLATIAHSYSVEWLGRWAEGIAYALAGAVYAIVTGSCLVWLVGQSGTRNSS